MPKSFDIRSLIKAREAHGKEVEALETAIKKAVNDAVNGMEIETVSSGENKDDSFNFTIWGKLVIE
jgi:DNA-binding protein YbaB